MTIPDPIVRILTLARWAPSGDNCQPWKFEIINEKHVVVHGTDTREWCLYDFDGHASHIAHGALIETIRIAASAEKLTVSWKRRGDSAGTTAIYDIHFQPEPELSDDPLLPFIESRVVKRRMMKTTPLTEEQKRTLASAVAPDLEVVFFETGSDKSNIAKLLWRSAYVRLTCPEAYSVHREVIEWNARFSIDRIPEEAVGVDRLTARLMRWVMHSWKRVSFFNKFLFGTILPRIQLDVLPAIFCGTHALLKPKARLSSTDDYVTAGMSIQRFWLTVASQGLYLQPQMTPVIFRWYARHEKPFSALPEPMNVAKEISDRFEKLANIDKQDDLAFFCRLGESSPPRSRSLRKALGDLIIRS